MGRSLARPQPGPLDWPRRSTDIAGSAAAVVQGPTACSGPRERPCPPEATAPSSSGISPRRRPGRRSPPGSEPLPIKEHRSSLDAAWVSSLGRLRDFMPPPCYCSNPAVRLYPIEPFQIKPAHRRTTWPFTFRKILLPMTLVIPAPTKCDPSGPAIIAIQEFVGTPISGETTRSQVILNIEHPDGSRNP